VFGGGFVSLNNDYGLGKQTLFDLIEERINKKLMGINLNLNTDSEGFYVSVFMELIKGVNSNDSGYTYFTNEVSIKNNRTLQVYYCKVFEGGNRDDETCYLIATTNELKKIEDIHSELIKQCKEQYIEHSKKLIEIETNLKTTRAELYFSLKDICEKPFSIPNMDCEFVKKGK